jgi:nitrous oxide reductase
MHGQPFNRRQFLAGTALAGAAPSLASGRGAADVSGLRVRLCRNGRHP